jgi:hypothetical protein
VPKSSGISPKTGMLPKNLDALSAKAAKENVDTARTNVKALNIFENTLIATPDFFRLQHVIINLFDNMRMLLMGAINIIDKISMVVFLLEICC